jgi:hypothetical protein
VNKNLRQVKILEVLVRAYKLFSTKSDERINVLVLSNKILLSESNVIISNMMIGFIFFLNKTFQCLKMNLLILGDIERA